MEIDPLKAVEPAVGAAKLTVRLTKGAGKSALQRVGIINEPKTQIQRSSEQIDTDLLARLQGYAERSRFGVVSDFYSSISDGIDKDIDTDVARGIADRWLIDEHVSAIGVCAITPVEQIDAIRSWEKATQNINEVAGVLRDRTSAQVYKLTHDPYTIYDTARGPAYEQAVNVASRALQRFEALPRVKDIPESERAIVMIARPQELRQVWGADVGDGQTGVMIMPQTIPLDGPPTNTVIQPSRASELL
jgi:hypothetical protein